MDIHVKRIVLGHRFFLNIPLYLMFTTGQAAGLVGTVDKVDVDEYGEAAGNFLRARVAIPVEKPLKRFITIERRKIDEVYDIQYEKLPFFCFSCGVMGHSKIECLAPNDRDQQGKRGYNNSIRAPEEKRKKMQPFSHAAAASDWSGSSARNDSRANSRGQSSEDGGDRLAQTTEWSRRLPAH
jgi:hypothetical protein